MYYQHGTPVGNMPPQAAVNGPRMPPQAQAGMIGMLPPQAQAGLGRNAETTPQMVADTTMPAGDPRAYRDGVFGRRYRRDTRDNPLRPWRDGVFGPALGEYFASGMRGLGQDNENGGPEITLTRAVITDVQRALNLLVGSYSPPQPAGAWDKQTEAAYVTFIEENTPGFDDKNVLYRTKNGRKYPSARGLFVLMQSAKQQFRQDYGPEAGDEVWANMYEELAPFTKAYEAADMQGKVVIPKDAGRTENGDAMQASTLLMWGGGAALLGLGLYALTRKKRR